MHKHIFSIFVLNKTKTLATVNLFYNPIPGAEPDSWSLLETHSHLRFQSFRKKRSSVRRRSTSLRSFNTVLSQARSLR